MTEFLKGNYPMKGKKNVNASKRKKSLTDEFETSALAKLGGSLCFVMKKKTFTWSPDAESAREIDH